MEVRWAFNIERWCPTEDEWSGALQLTSAEEQARIGRFKRPTRLPGGTVSFMVGRHNPDAKAALAGRLLILLAAASAYPDLHLHRPLRFGRTTQGKPYLIPFRVEMQQQRSIHWNFNVSHAGEWVVLASESMYLIGVDVMKVELRGSNPSISTFFHDMRSCFTPVEWTNIHHNTINTNNTSEADHARQQLERFFTHWTLKEAYIKAVGIGLGFDLQRAQFACEGRAWPQPHTGVIGATLEIDGQARPEWSFALECLDAHHIVAVARGPLAQAIESYKQCVEEEMKETKEEVEEMKEEHRSWRVWTFEELMREIQSVGATIVE